MTTDLTDDSDLDEEEFRWDDFLPDPDDAELAAEAAALDDQADLDLDDSDLDWEAALREDTEQEIGADGSAHAGAAFDRIVDTVRRSFEEPESKTELDTDTELEIEAALELEAETGPVADLETELELGTERSNAEMEPEVQLEAEPEAELEAELESEPEAEFGEELESEPEAELEAELALAMARALAMELEPEAELQSEPEAELELDPELELESDEDLRAGTDVQTAWKLAIAAEFGWDVEDLLTTSAGLEPETNPDADPNAAAVVVAAPELIVSWEAEPEPEAEPDPEVGEATEWPSDDPVETTDWLWDDPEVGEATEWPSDDDFYGPSRPRRSKRDEREKRSRVFTTTVVLACVFAGLVAGAAAERWLHRPTPAVTTPAAHSTARVSSTSGAAQIQGAQIQTATDAADSATTAARVGLASLPSFPTPANVEREINPYLSSLQLYASFLSGRKVPEQAQSAAASAEAQVAQDLQFLRTIDGLPPLQLGAYMTQFETEATQLQATLNTLEQNLRPPIS